MRKALIIKGYTQENQLGNLALVVEDIMGSIHIIDLSKIRSKGCVGCNYCQSINPGICCMKDTLGYCLSEYLDNDLDYKEQQRKSTS